MVSYMNSFKKNKRIKSKNTLFNPYKNGISSYDLAFLSSKKVSKSNLEFLKNFAAKKHF